VEEQRPLGFRTQSLQKRPYRNEEEMKKQAKVV